MLILHPLYLLVYGAGHGTRTRTLLKPMILSHCCLPIPAIRHIASFLKEKDANLLVGDTGLEPAWRKPPEP